MDDGIIAFSPVWMAEIFRTDVTRAFNSVLMVPVKWYQTVQSIALILTEESLFASSNVYNVHILLRLGKNYEK